MTESPALDCRGAGRFPHSVVAIGSSAGGLHALTVVLELLPIDFAAAIVVVQHLEPSHPSMMVKLLARKTPLMVQAAETGVKLKVATVYIAPPSCHMLVKPGGHIALTHTQKVHFARPSVDVLLRSVAEACWERAAAVILSGTGVDGAEGCREIRRHGGYLIAQDEETSEFDGMPRSARQTGLIDEILPLLRIAPALISWVRGNQHG